MTDRGVSDSDMPTLPWQTRPEAQALDGLLSGNCRPEEVPADLRPVAEVLVALQAPPDRREVAGWGQALTVYREIAGRPGMPGRPRSRRPRLIAPPLGARFAAAAGAAVIAVLGGGVAAAYTGSLPGALQKIAHEAIAAPGARESSAAPTPQSSGRPAGPSITSAAAYGLCNAYQHAEEHGNASQRSVAFRNLVNAAGGADQVAAYCASVPRPGATSPPGRRVGQTVSPTDASHGRKPTTPPGKPTTPPAQADHPAGQADHPTGQADHLSGQRRRKRQRAREVVVMSAMRSLRFAIYLRSTPQQVRAVLSDPALVPRWLAGTQFQTDAEEDPRRLSCEWLQTDHLDANGGSVSVVRFEFVAMGQVTQLTVIHRDLVSGGSFLKVVAAGWPMILSSLKSLIETGKPLEFRNSG